ncbi:hypothetical protein ACWGE0_31825 [Lentzea sp. NPDC054927]
MASRSGADPATLGELVAAIDDVPRDQTIYVPAEVPEEDVGPATPVTLVPDPEEAGEDEDEPDPPPGTRYLLEVWLAKEVLEVWSSWRGGRRPSLDEACGAVAHYAGHDAYQPVD